jgi:asparagine synthase (glutamine-hydrolysing)
MRRALAGIVPPQIQWRRDKADLSPNFTRRLFEADRETLQDVVVSRIGRLQEYVQVGAVREAYDRWSKEPRGHGQDGLMLFSIATLAFWFDAAGIEGSPGLGLADKSR